MSMLDDIAANMAKPENKVLYAFMHRAIPTYGLKYEGIVREILTKDNNRDARIAQMITHAWASSLALEGQEFNDDLGGLKHEIHGLADAPGKVVLIWPPHSPKQPPLGLLSALVYPDGGKARYFVLEYNIDFQSREECPPVLGEWSFVEGNPNPVHGNFGHFGVANEAPDAKKFVDRVSMMVAHPGMGLDKKKVRTTSSADGQEIKMEMGGANVTIKRPQGPQSDEQTRAALNKLIEDVKEMERKAAENKKNEENDENSLT